MSANIPTEPVPGIEAPPSETTAAPEPTASIPESVASASAASPENPEAEHERPENPLYPKKPREVVLGPDGQPLSRNQQKKLMRQKRFDETREQWKQQKREKAKALKIRKREAKAAEASTGEKRAAPEDEDAEELAKRMKTNEPVKKVVEDITLIMDCGFDELMTDKEIKSMSSQLTRCYSANRASPHQFKMHVSSLNKRLLHRYQTVLMNQHLKYKGITFSEEPYAIDDSLVYLTADSENTIEELEIGKKYIIGGIVDRNRHKMLCFNKAKEQNIPTARLPIGQYLQMASRQVLTTNQVVEIMLEWLNERDWQKAFVKVIPQRKMWKVKGKGGAEGAEGEEGKEDDGEGEGEEDEENDEEDKAEEQAAAVIEVTEKTEKMDVDASASS